MPIPGDNSICKPEADVLGRMAAANSFARHVLDLDASEGTTVGVFDSLGVLCRKFPRLRPTRFHAYPAQTILR